MLTSVFICTIQYIDVKNSKLLFPDLHLQVYVTGGLNPDAVFNKIIKIQIE